MFCSDLTFGLRSSFVVVALSSAALVSAAEFKSEHYEFFEKKIRPVLVEHCYKCHSASSEKLKGELFLDTKEGMLKGGESGKPAVVPGDADKSRLIEAIRYGNEDLQMPPKKAGGKLSEEQIADFVAWVNLGAPDPRTGKVPRSAFHVPRSQHWAFQPPKQTAVPEVKNTRWPQTPIDNFILAKLEENGLQPSLPADKRTLIRRATYDLIGLPPTPDEVDAFLKDQSSEAFARVVESLLSSPRYGERWGRYWLDVARYSDTKGYVYTDREEGRFVHSYAYRDWVIRALNEDMPYDKFLRLQIAADQIVGRASSLSPSLAEGNSETGKMPVLQNPDDLAAMGFLTLGRRFLGVVHDIIDDRIDVVMRGTQGLTVGCARCHDHKYDPIPTKDYYSLAGVFLSTSYHEYPLVPKGVVDEYTQQDKRIEKKEKLLEEFTKTESSQLGETLALQASKYMVAAWKVSGEPKEEISKIVDAEKLDYELFDRWLKFLAKPPRFYPYLTKWQEMVKGGGTASEAKKLADEFQTLLLDVMFDKKDVRTRMRSSPPKRSWARRRRSP